MVEGMSVREAAREFGLHRDTVIKMLKYSVPLLGTGGASRSSPTTEAGDVHRSHRPDTGRRQGSAEEAAAHHEADL